MSTVFSVALDYSPELRREARRLARKEGTAQLAILLYATCIEHLVNELTAQALSAYKISHKQIANEAIRQLSIGSKCTWLRRVIGLDEVDAETIRKIKRIIEARNRFAHYKWTPQSWTAPLGLAVDSALFGFAEAVITTLKKLRERDLTYLGKLARQPRLKKFSRPELP